MRQLPCPVDDAISRWDRFVEEHPFGWFHHLSGWKKVLENSFKHMKGHYFVRMDESGNNIRAALPVFQVNSWLTGNRIVSIPFSSLCDPFISDSDDMLDLLQAVISFSNEKKSTYIEIRTLFSSPLISSVQLTPVNHYKHHYLVLDREPELMKKCFHRSCVRQKISRAVKSYLKCIMAGNLDDLKDFYRLHVMDRKRLGLPPQPYVFFQSLWDEFFPSKQVSILLAKKDDESIAGILLYKYKDRVSAEFAVINEIFRGFSPNHFLFWEAIKSSYEEGFKIFDFGRTSSFNKGLMDFKRRWNTKMIDLPQFYYPKRVTEKISINNTSLKYRFVRKLCRNVPDFMFPTIGKFIYRHMG